MTIPSRRTGIKPSIEKNQSSSELDTNLTRKKVAVLGNQAFSLVNFRTELLCDIQALGCEVVALAPDFDDTTREQLKKCGIRDAAVSLERAGLNPIRDVIDLYRLWCVFREEKPDVLLTYTIKPVIYGTLAAMFAGTSKRYALIAGLGYAFAKPNTSRQMLVNLVARFLYWLALAFCQCVFVQNPDDADDFVRMRIVPRRKIRVVNGTGVNLDIWQFAKPALDPIRFTLAARLLPEKGIREFALAAREIKAQHPEVRFLLLGGLDDNPSAISEGEVAEWVKEGTLEWPGHRPVGPLLQETSVFVLPSYYREGIPRSIQEALATGRPVITTDWIGCRETVTEGENGFLVPPRDVEALAAAMRRFIAEPELIARMGTQSRQLAEQRFDVRKINKAMIDAMGL